MKVILFSVGSVLSIGSMFESHSQLNPGSKRCIYYKSKCPPGIRVQRLLPECTLSGSHWKNTLSGDYVIRNWFIGLLLQEPCLFDLHISIPFYWYETSTICTSTVTFILWIGYIEMVKTICLIKVYPLAIYSKTPVNDYHPHVLFVHISDGFSDI